MQERRVETRYLCSDLVRLLWSEEQRARDETVVLENISASGACVQAAAVALGVLHAEIAQIWGLGVHTPLEPSAEDAAGVRARYAELRSATHPSTA